jgi:hypothetical protein
MMIQPTAAQRNQIATMSCTLRAIWRRFSAGIKTPQAIEEPYIEGSPPSSFLQF